MKGNGLHILCKIKVLWNPDVTKCNGLGKCVRYNGRSLYRGSFPYIFFNTVLKNIFRMPEEVLICKEKSELAVLHGGLDDITGFKGRDKVKLNS